MLNWSTFKIKNKKNKKSEGFSLEPLFINALLIIYAGKMKRSQVIYCFIWRSRLGLIRLFFFHEKYNSWPLKEWFYCSDKILKYIFNENIFLRITFLNVKIINYFIASDYLCNTTEIINKNLNGRKISSLSAHLFVPTKAGRNVNTSYKQGSRYFRNRCFLVELELNQSFKSRTKRQNYHRMLIADYLDLS